MAALVGAVSFGLAPTLQGAALAAFGWLLLPLFLLVLGLLRGNEEGWGSTIILAELTGVPTEAFFRSTASVRHHELSDLARDEIGLVHLRRLRAQQRRLALTAGDVGAVPAGLEQDRLASRRVVTELAAHVPDVHLDRAFVRFGHERPGIRLVTAQDPGTGARLTVRLVPAAGWVVEDTADGTTVRPA